MGVGAPVVPSRDSLTRAALRLALVVLVAVAAGVITSGCPRPRDCTPASQRCEGDTPVICDGEGRSWRASGDPVVTCAQVGGVCTVRDGRAFCAASLPSNPFVDGGVR